MKLHEVFCDDSTTVTGLTGLIEIDNCECDSESWGCLGDSTSNETWDSAELEVSEETAENEDTAAGCGCVVDLGLL